MPGFCMFKNKSIVDFCYCFIFSTKKNNLYVKMIKAHFNGKVYNFPISKNKM